MRSKSKIHLFVAVIGLLIASIVLADTITKPYTFAPGTTIKSSEINAVLDALYNQINKIGALIDIDSTNARVGIGTAAPAEKLEVNGTVKATAFQGDGSALTGISPGIPAGVIVMWSGAIANIPAGWALCDGTNGAPDLRDRFIVGARQDDAGMAKTNVKGSLMQIGGEHQHTLTISEMPAHDHILKGYTNYEPGNDGGSRYYFSELSIRFNFWNLQAPTEVSGGNQPHENCPPFYALAFIMKL